MDWQQNRRTEQKDKVLIVDDDPVVGSFLSHTINSRGYEAVYYQNPIEALYHAQKESFSLAFIDVQMPEMSGLELISLLKRYNPRIEIILVSGYGSLDDTVKAIKIGISDYLKKPFTVDEVSFCLSHFEERVRIRKQLEKTEERYSRLVENVPLIIFSINRDLQLTFVNKTLEAILGYTPDEIIEDERWFEKIVHQEDRERLRRSFLRFFEGDCTPFKDECRFIHKKSHIVYTLVQSLPLYQGNSGACEMDGIVVDITDRVFYEKSLVQGEKLKTLGAIATEVAHEIRNPLTSIGGFARRIKKKYPELKEADIVLQEVHRLEQLLNRIRQYLQPVEARRICLNVNEQVTRCYELLMPEMEQKGVMCELSLGQYMPYIFVDPNMLLQVLINLFRNAIDGCKCERKFRVITFATENHVHIQCITPLQPGEELDCESVFLPFSEGGKSIGLPLSYRLVKNMGGILTCFQEGNNAIFTATFPVAQLEECNTNIDSGSL